MEFPVSPILARPSQEMCATTTPTWVRAPLLLCPLPGSQHSPRLSHSSRHSVQVSSTSPSDAADVNQRLMKGLREHEAWKAWFHVDSWLHLHSVDDSCMHCSPERLLFVHHALRTVCFQGITAWLLLDFQMHDCSATSAQTVNNMQLCLLAFCASCSREAHHCNLLGICDKTASQLSG